MFGKILKETIKKAGFTQEEFAKEIGTVRALVSQWITGVRNPSAKNLKKISEVLKLPVDYFFQESAGTAITKETTIIKGTDGADGTEKTAGEKKPAAKYDKTVNSKIAFIEQDNKRIEAENISLKKDVELLKEKIKILESKIL